MEGRAEVATISSAIRNAQGKGMARIDAQLLLLHALGTPPALASAQRAWLLAHGDDPLAPGAAQRFADFLARRARGEPLAYITGHKEFFSLALQVDARVLVPRPDTETLVVWALDVLAQTASGIAVDPLRVLDLGTGSGAIALALKNARPQMQVHATDVSAAALEVAKANAGVLGLEIGFALGAWLDAAHGRYHCIVSNPPYVADGDPHLSALCHEPLSALTAGPDGLRDIRQIVANAGRYLYPGGWLLLEHGYDQSAAVLELLAQAGFRNRQSRHDLGGHTRCCAGQFGVQPASAA